MALFEGNRLKPGSRSYTKLIVSGGDSPAELWKAKNDLPKLFDYPYGGLGQTDVIISKGMIVAIDNTTPYVRDYDTNRWITQVTLADANNLKVIGMTPYNITRKVDDRFTGNQPTIITREYVELPYFPNSDDAKGCLWGNVSGTLAPGDFVKVSPDPDLKGRLIKWEPATDTADLLVGQVLAKEPLGSNYDFLQWVMWPDEAKRTDDVYINRTGYSAPGINGYPFDPLTFSKDGTGGLQEMAGYLSQFTSNPTGVPGLHDGRNSRNTELTRNLGSIIAGTPANTPVTFFVEPNLIEGSVTFNVAGTAVPVTDPQLAIDYRKGLIIYTPAAPIATDSPVEVIYKAMHYGTPVITDFANADGVVRVLLKF